MPDLLLFANNVNSSLLAQISAAATTMTVGTAEAASFPSPAAAQYFVVTLTSGTTKEIVWCTSRTSNVLTIVRAKEGTVASIFPAGTVVSMHVTAGMMTYLRDN